MAGVDDTDAPLLRLDEDGGDVSSAEGEELLHALGCERQTGAGITSEVVREGGLPLPERDYLPVSLEEKIICVADKFYSKKPAKLWEEKKPRAIARTMDRWGPRVRGRWDELAAAFLVDG